MLYHQYESDLINPETEMNYAYRTSYQNVQLPHYHDFYEIFLVLEGVQGMEINQHKMTLPAGSLVLIRPNDIHDRYYIDSGCHINIAFSTNIAEALFQYLGEGFHAELFTADSLPPHTLLSQSESNHVKAQMEQIYTISTRDTMLQRTMLRTLIMELFVQYFAKAVHSPIRGDENSWLSDVLIAMHRPENIVKGLPALMELSNRSHEYICRTFRQQLGCTPTGYINSLRLNYAANFLIHSDISIIDICYNSGFRNLSHFYHQFNTLYHMSPARYRKKYADDPSLGKQM